MAVIFVLFALRTYISPMQYIKKGKQTNNLHASVLIVGKYHC